MGKIERIIETLWIQSIINRLSNNEILEIELWLSNRPNVYPFSDVEFVISSLLWIWAITMDEYEYIRTNYISENEYLFTFEMAWKSFWTWSEQRLLNGWYNLKKPSKKTDENYSQKTSYDAYLEYEDFNIRIEIKSARVTESWNNTDIFIEKALSSNSEKPFWMNFQQLKPQYSDVFIFVAVYRDGLTYWVLSSDEVKHYWDSEFDIWTFSKWQHSWNAWNEWQLHIKNTNIQDFDEYKVDPMDIKYAIIKAFHRQYNY